jgi:hypothetical protein
MWFEARRKRVRNESFTSVHALKKAGTSIEKTALRHA